MASGGRKPPDTTSKNADRYLAAATKAADFVLANLRTKEGRLLRTYSKAGDEGGKGKLNAYLDDYAFLADGLLRLHRATGSLVEDPLRHPPARAVRVGADGVLLVHIADCRHRGTGPR